MKTFKTVLKEEIKDFIIKKSKKLWIGDEIIIVTAHIFGTMASKLSGLTEDQTIGRITFDKNDKWGGSYMTFDIHPTKELCKKFPATDWSTWGSLTKDQRDEQYKKDEKAVLDFILTSLLPYAQNIVDNIKLS